MWIAIAPAALAETPKTHKHTNHLIDAASPYLLQHAHNPVNWYPWGDEAFDKAVKEDKPIFLSIGYAACHWCHVMERESFENEVVAAVLNEHFVAIKVDREERPDVDEIYMSATVAMSGRGGWPMSVFMTPDRKPFVCGTYYPPNDRRGRRGFRGLCLDIANQWANDRAKLLSDASSLVTKVRRRKTIGHSDQLVPRATLSRNVDRMAGRFDLVLGGRRTSGNKFPPTMALELMMREFATQRLASKPELLAPVETTLTQMYRGGIYDHLGGGICRYSTDPRWFAPHFEKMLYDQGTVSGVYLSAFQLTGNQLYGDVARGILDYCIEDLQSPEGGFYSSRDADSEGEEGKFYTWRYSEIMNILSPEDAALFNDYYNVKRGGNWHGGVNILHLKTSDEEFARKHGLSIEDWRGKRDKLRSTMFMHREVRVHPGLDDKILVEWNGLIINNLARAYRIFNEPKYRDAAVRATDFILREMVRDGRIFRAHRKGTTHIVGYASDYTNLVEALITLYETTFELRWLKEAERLNDSFIKHFADKDAGGFFYTADDGEELLVRSKNLRDSVVPSGNSTAILNCLRLAILLDRKDLRDVAEATLRMVGLVTSRGALERAQWGILFHLEHPREIAIIGDPASPDTQALIAEVYRQYIPNKIVMHTTPEEAAKPDALPLLRRKTLVRGKPGAYVCRNYRCGKPVNSPAELAKQLEDFAP